MSTVRITQRRSRNGANKRQLATLRSLGLRRIGQSVEHRDSPQLRGMVHAVRHLVEVDGDHDRQDAGRRSQQPRPDGGAR